MGGKTKKVGIAGKYGTRYGSVLRKRTKAILTKMHSKDTKCPRCQTKGSIQRISTGIWYCKKCEAKFTGGAYDIVTPRGAESFRVSKRKQRELELVEEE